MNRTNYCSTHARNCFAGSSLSSSCRRSSEFDFEVGTGSDDGKDAASEEERKHDRKARPAMLIADLFVPSHINNHRIVRGGRTPAQIQFLVEWLPGWTSDESLAQKVVRKHPNEDLWFVQYRTSWEPYSAYYDTITPDMISQYKADNNIDTFGPGFDEKIEALSRKERQSLAAEDLYPNYQFHYKEVSEDQCGSDAEQVEPPLRKRRGRPKKDNAPKQRRILNERNPDCGCALDCLGSFDRPSRERITAEFQALPNFAARSTWLSHLVELKSCPFRGEALQIRSKRRKTYTAKYAFMKRGGVRVCKPFFQAVLSIGNTALSNLNEHNFRNRGSQLVQRVDGRGRHKPRHAASEEEISTLQRHVSSFPRERSHYTLEKKESLDPSLDVKKMWALYKEQQDTNGTRALGYGKYLQIFNQYDLKFGAYKTDTCSTCDKLQEQMSADPDNEELKQQKGDHLRQANMAYKMQKQDRDNSDDRTHAIWGDMMSVAQVPKLPTGASFYLRKLKVYNEDFYSAVRDQHSMFLWNQLEGKKGANDVISCLHAFLETIPATCKHLICWFDGTSSQLKNTTTLLYLLHRTDSTSPIYKFERISLKYAPPGHTYMAPDRAFGNVAKQLKKKQVIGDPKELMHVINDDCKNTRAQWLDRTQHFNWGSYLGQYYNTDKDFLRVNGEPLLMRARCFSFGFTQVQDEETNQSILVQNYQNEIKIRLVFDMDSEWHSFRVDQATPKRAATYDAYVAYPEPLKIDRNRIRDLRKQREWLPAKYQDLVMYSLNDTDAASDSKEEASTEECK